MSNWGTEPFLRKLLQGSWKDLGRILEGSRKNFGRGKMEKERKKDAAHNNQRRRIAKNLWASQNQRLGKESRWIFDGEYSRNPQNGVKNLQWISENFCCCCLSFWCVFWCFCLLGFWIRLEESWIKSKESLRIPRIPENPRESPPPLRSRNEAQPIRRTQTNETEKVTKNANKSQTKNKRQAATAAGGSGTGSCVLCKPKTSAGRDSWKIQSQTKQEQISRGWEGGREGETEGGREKTNHL